MRRAGADRSDDLDVRRHEFLMIFLSNGNPDDSGVPFAIPQPRISGIQSSSCRGFV
jgi:hypothetical protein